MVAPLNTVLPLKPFYAPPAPVTGTPVSSSTGSWNGASGLAWAYQWLRCTDTASVGTCTAIATNGTGASYEPVTADLGRYLRVEVTASKGGASTSATSDATDDPVGAVVAHSGSVTFSGTAAVGSVLTQTSAGTFTGTPAPTITRNWQRSDGLGGWDDIAGATGTTYTIAAGDYQKQLRLRVTGTNIYNTIDAFSSGSGAVAGLAPANSVAPVASGSLVLGQTLTVTNGTWTGTPTPAFTYRWETSADGLGGWATLPGETTSSYTLVLGDQGNYFRAVVIGTNVEGSDEAPSNVLGPATTEAPANAVSPLVTAPQGTVQGEVATATNGTWTGGPAPTYTYVWEISLDGVSGWVPLPTETASTYTFGPSDVGDYLRVVVTATNMAGSDSAPSNAVGPVT